MQQSPECVINTYLLDYELMKYVQIYASWQNQMYNYVVHLYYHVTFFILFLIWSFQCTIESDQYVCCMFIWIMLWYIYIYISQQFTTTIKQNHYKIMWTLAFTHFLIFNHSLVAGSRKWCLLFFLLLVLLLLFQSSHFRSGWFIV